MPEQFRPCWTVGGKISPDEVDGRSARTTSEELNKLQNSAQYKAWQKKQTRATCPLWLCTGILGVLTLMAGDLSSFGQHPAATQDLMPNRTQHEPMLEGIIFDLRVSLNTCESLNDKMQSTYANLKEQEMKLVKEIEGLKGEVQKSLIDRPQAGTKQDSSLEEIWQHAREFAYEVIIGFLILLSAWIGLQYKDALLSLKEQNSGLCLGNNGHSPQKHKELHEKNSPGLSIDQELHRDLMVECSSLPKVLEQRLKLIEEKKALQTSIEDNEIISSEVEELQQKKKALDYFAEEAAELKIENSRLEARVAATPQLRKRYCELLEMSTICDRIENQIKILEARNEKLPEAQMRYNQMVSEVKHLNQIEMDYDYLMSELAVTSELCQFYTQKQQQGDSHKGCGFEHGGDEPLTYLSALEAEVYSNNFLALMQRIHYLEDHQIDRMIDGWFDLLTEFEGSDSTEPPGL